MRNLILSLVLLLFCGMVNGQVVEPEYIGQAYALVNGGERVELSSEIGYLSANSTVTGDSFSLSSTNEHSYGSATTNIWSGFASTMASASTYSTTGGFSVSKVRTKSANYLNVSGEESKVKLLVNKPFSVVLRLDDNDHLPETQIKIVRFTSKSGVRSAHEGSSVSFQATKLGNSSYQITLDDPFYGEYGVVYKNDMNVVLTFSLGYSNEDVRAYVKPFLEEGSIEMIREFNAIQYEIFDVRKGDYIWNDAFAELYGESFMKRIVAEYKQQKKALVKARRAAKKTLRKANRKK